MDGSVVGAAAASRKTSRLKQYKTHIVNLKWDSNSISNSISKSDKCKIYITKKHLTTTDEVKTVDFELNCRN